MKNKYLVCGAEGFIGGHLVKSLLDDGHEVVCADVKPQENWLRGLDLNQGPSGYEPDELPDCSTPR